MMLPFTLDNLLLLGQLHPFMLLPTLCRIRSLALVLALCSYSTLSATDIGTPLLGTDPNDRTGRDAVGTESPTRSSAGGRSMGEATARGAAGSQTTERYAK